MPTSGPERLGPDPRPADQKLWDPAMQAMSRDERRALQDERLRDTVRRAFERPVPLFKRKLEEAGVAGPDDIKSIDDLVRIPTTVKNDLRQSEAEAPPFGDYRFTDARSASASPYGTTSKPGVNGPKPTWAVGSVEKLTIVTVRPWKLPSATTIFARSGATPFTS